MNTLQQLRDELKEEFETTQQFFERYPDDKNDYAPHEKSMKMNPLANHISDCFSWPAMIVHTDKLDFAAGDYAPVNHDSGSDLLQSLNDNYQKGMQVLNDLQDESKLEERWGMYNGEHKLWEWSRYGAIRHALSQITHHRAQLGVYYRLNDIAIPSSYGPTADDNMDF